MQTISRFLSYQSRIFIYLEHSKLLCPRSFHGTSQFATSQSKKEEENNHSSSLVGRDFLSLKNFRAEELKQLLWTAKDLKTRIKHNDELFQPLQGKSASLLFYTKSTKTRLSIEQGLAKLGGHAAFLGIEQIDVNENVKDTARVLASMSDLIVARVAEQEVLETLSNEANIPVINGMSDLLHPLQTLGDFMTIQESFGYLRGCKIAYIGSGNNILNSLMIGCAKLGVDLSISTPPGYEPDIDLTLEAVNLAGKTGASLQIGHDPLESVYRADAIMSNFSVGTGQEFEDKKRLVDLQNYRVDRKMLKEAGGNWVFLHSLPRKQEEVEDNVFHGKESLVLQQAENRMWTVMSVMLHLTQDYKPTIPMPKYVRG